MIRRALQGRIPQSSREYAMYNKHGTGEHQDDGHDPELHMLHCLDYLRQVSIFFIPCFLQVLAIDANIAADCYVYGRRHH